MRYLIVFLFVCFLSCSGDKTEEEFIPASVSHLIGNWELTATKICPGHEVDWSPSEEKGVYSFHIDGTYTHEFEEDKVSGTYTVLDNRLTTIYVSKDGETITRSYYFLLSTTELILNYVGCIEACSLRYRKLE